YSLPWCRYPIVQDLLSLRTFEKKVSSSSGHLLLISAAFPKKRHYIWFAALLGLPIARGNSVFPLCLLRHNHNDKTWQASAKWVFKSQTSLSTDSGLCTERGLRRTHIELVKPPGKRIGLKLAGKGENYCSLLLSQTGRQKPGPLLG
ncbi:jg15742, partial [Pararge aegeria aegeria]